MLRKILVLIISFHTLSFANSTKAKELYDFALRTSPLGANSLEMFQTASQNRSLRDELSGVIESHSQLKASAENGLAVRDQFKTWLKEVFGDDRAMQELFLDPYRETWRRYEAYRLSLRKPVEKPISHDTASSRALDEAIRRFTFMTRDEVVLDVQHKENGPYDFYKRRLKYWLGETETKMAPPDKLDPRQLADWKRKMASELDEVSRKILESRVRKLTEAEGLYLGAGSTRFEQLRAAVGPGSREGFIPPSEAGNVTLKIEELQKDGAHRGDVLPRTSFWLLKFIPQILGAAVQYPDVLFRRTMDPVKRRESDEPTAGYLSYEGVVAQLEWRPSASYLQRNPNPRRSTSQRVSLNELIQQTGTPGRSGDLLSSTSDDWVGRNPLFSFQVAGLRGVGELSVIQQVLNDGNLKTAQRFEEVFRQTEARRNDSEVRSLLGPFMDRSLLERQDLVAGLEWDGYARSPYHWWHRDSIADPKVVTKGGETKERTGWRWRRAMGDRFSKSGSFVRGATLWGLLGLNIWGGLEIIKGLPKLNLNGNFSEEEGVGQSSPPHGLSPEELGSAYNKNIGNGAGAGTVVFHLENKQGTLMDKPIHIDTITKDQTGMRHSESPEVNNERNPDTEPAKITFSIENRLPLHVDELGQMILPSVQDHEVAKLEIRMGDHVFERDSYVLHEDAVTGRYYVEFPGLNHRAFADSYFVRVDYAPSSKRTENPGYEEFLHLDADRLGALNVELKAKGYIELQYKLADLIRDIRLGNQKSLKDLADVFSRTGIYPESLDEKTRREETATAADENLHSLTRFLKGGIFHAQCDGANMLFQAYLKKYFRNDPNVSVVGQQTFVRESGEADVPLGNAHLMTIVATREGNYRMTLDATPDKLPSSLDWYVVKTPSEFVGILPERVRLVGGGPPKKNPNPRLVPATPAEHAARLANLDKTQAEARENPAFQLLSAKNKVAVNSKSVLALGSALRSFASHEMSFRKLVTEIDRLFPGHPQAKDPRDLNPTLESIALRYQMQSQSIQQAAGKLRTGAHRVLASPIIWKPFVDTLKWYADTHWMPVHRPHAEEAQTIALMPAEESEHDERTARLDRLKRELSQDERSAMVRQTLGIQRELDRVMAIGEALKDYADGKSSFRGLLEKLNEAYPELVHPSEVKDPTALPEILRSIHSHLEAEGRAQGAKVHGGAWKEVLRFSEFYSQTRWMPVYRFNTRKNCNQQLQAIRN